MEFIYLSKYGQNKAYKKSDGIKCEIIITTPENCMTKNELSRINYELIVIDEAHKLKNYNSKLTTTLREEYSYRNVLLLTGM